MKITLATFRNVCLGTLLCAITLCAMPASSKITLPSGKQVFVSGMNLAWINYGRDFANEPLDTNEYKYSLQDIRNAGGNVVRIWVYPNGANAPKFDATTGLVTAPGDSTISNLVKALDIADRMGMLVVPTLLSQNLGATEQVGVNWTNNQKLLTTDAGRNAFIQNALLPLVNKVQKHEALLCWEVFNEPEGMVSGNYANGTVIGWVAQRIDSTYIKKMVNAVAGAIHRAVPGVLVSNGTQTFASNSTVDGNTNWYSDASLKAAGGDSLGVLDFYMVHYYPWNGVAYSPFTHPASHWNLDKPVVMAEFPADSWSQKDAFQPQGNHPIYDVANIDTLFDNLYRNGYAGAMSWSYYRDTYDTWLGSFATSAPSLSALYAAHKSDIMIKEYTSPTATGNGVLQVGYVNADNSVWSSIKKDTTMDLSAYKTLSVDVLVPKSSTGTLNMHLVLKTGDAWEWDVSDTYCTPKADSTWSTCSADLASIHFYQNQTKANLKQVHSVYVHFTTNDAFTGKIWFDNFKVDNTVLWNFDNTQRPTFSVDTYNANEAVKVKSIDVVFPAGGGVVSNRIAPTQQTSFQAIRTQAGIQVSVADVQDLQIQVRDLQGRTLYQTSFHGANMILPVQSSQVLVIDMKNQAGEHLQKLLAPVH